MKKKKKKHEKGNQKGNKAVAKDTYDSIIHINHELWYDIFTYIPFCDPSMRNIKQNYYKTSKRDNKENCPASKYLAFILYYLIKTTKVKDKRKSQKKTEERNLNLNLNPKPQNLNFNPKK